MEGKVFFALFPLHFDDDDDVVSDQVFLQPLRVKGGRES